MEKDIWKEYDRELETNIGRLIEKLKGKPETFDFLGFTHYWYYWMNQKSQKRSYDWKGFKEVLKIFLLA